MPRLALSADEIAEARERAGAAAQALFVESGARALSMRAIAAALELSPMALYRYFPRGKAEIVDAVRARGFRALARALEAGAGRGREIRERLAACLEGGCRFGVANERLYRLMFERTGATDSDPGSEVAAARRRALAPIEALCRQAVDRGVFIGDVATITHLLIAAAHGLVSFEISRQPYRERRIAHLLRPMLRSLFDGLRAGALADLEEPP